MEEKERGKNYWERLKIFVGVVGLAFVVTLALIVGSRLSDEALGVLAGAVCGVGAAIPTSLIIVAVTRRRDASGTSWGKDAPTSQQASYPPVVVISPQGGQQQPSGWDGYPPSLSAPTQRTFTVVGEPSADRGDAAW
jgi:hypothetical protein